MQTGDTNCIYKNDLSKACFQHDMAYGKYKDLERRKQSDKVCVLDALTPDQVSNCNSVLLDIY